MVRPFDDVDVLLLLRLRRPPPRRSRCCSFAHPPRWSSSPRGRRRHLFCGVFPQRGFLYFLIRKMSRRWSSKIVKIQQLSNLFQCMYCIATQSASLLFLRCFSSFASACRLSTIKPLVEKAERERERYKEEGR